MLWLKTHYHVVAIDKIPDTSGNTVALSFDDGYASWYTNVFPIIKELNIPVCFFVNSGLLQLDYKTGKEFLRSKVRRKEDTLAVINAKQLAEMAVHPLVTIGGHSKDHCDFSIAHSDQYLEEQIISDKLRLEQLIGKQIHLFAYPFGQLSNAPKHVQEIVERAGYTHAFTIIPGFENENRFLQYRDSLELWQSKRVWDRWLHGAYDGLVRKKLALQNQI